MWGTPRNAGLANLDLRQRTLDERVNNYCGQDDETQSCQNDEKDGGGGLESSITEACLID